MNELRADSAGDVVALPDVQIVGPGPNVHLSEIFAAAVEAVGATEKMRLAMHRSTDHAVALRRGPRGADDVGVFEHDIGGRTDRYAIVTDPTRIAARVADLEPPNLDAAEIDDDGATMKCPSPHIYLRHAVILTAAMLKRSEPEARWRAVEVSLDRLPSGSTIELAVLVRLAGRFWKIGLASDGIRLGHLLIARVDKLKRVGPD
jgi:hypothetical protein